VERGEGLGFIECAREVSSMANRSNRASAGRLDRGTNKGFEMGTKIAPERLEKLRVIFPHLLLALLALVVGDGFGFCEHFHEGIRAELFLDYRLIVI